MQKSKCDDSKIIYYTWGTRKYTSLDQHLPTFKWGFLLYTYFQGFFFRLKGVGDVGKCQGNLNSPSNIKSYVYLIQ